MTMVMLAVKKCIRIFILILWYVPCLSVCCTTLPAAWAQDTEAQTELSLEDKKAGTENDDESRRKAAILTLHSVLESISDLKKQLKTIEEELKTATTEEQKLQAAREINAVNNQWETFEKNFERIATGVDLAAFEAKLEREFDWKQEIQILLGPVIHELKQMTERPRKVERLRSQKTYYEDRKPVAETAIVNLQLLMKKVDDRDLKKRLEELEKVWMNRKQQISNQLTLVEYELEKREREREESSILKSSQKILRIFFQNRGKNFLVSIFVFTLVFFILRLGHKLLYLVSPIHKTGNRPFFIRLGDVLYYVFTFVGATCAALIALYVSGDWVVLILAIIFVIGIAWTAKQGIFLYMEQFKLLLNLGAVREGERIIYNGVPWKVVSLNIYSHLENPELDVGRVRLNLRDLVGYHSRPSVAHEPWFPSRLNDWVSLDDGVFGQVVSQSPEMVRIRLRGGNIKTYQTGAFLDLNPVNLSNDFRIRVVFGIDYGHQEFITEEIPGKLRVMLRNAIEADGYGRDFKSLKVEFKQAGASSLDLEVLADFRAGAAPYYERINRKINRICVDACNANSWVIPFTQLTLHYANPQPAPRPADESET